MTTHERMQRFRVAYTSQRAAEGRGAGGTAELLALPYLRSGGLARGWSVRARTFERFVTAIVKPRARAVRPRPLRILDLGAGNGWLCYRLSLLGHDAIAVDLRDDGIDGLGAARGYARHLPRMFPRSVASFDALPFRPRQFDIVVFNASVHYAIRLEDPLAEAARCTAERGCIAILDSPFYGSDAAGRAMVREKHARAAEQFGERAEDLLGVDVIEYLTDDRLERASHGLRLRWRRHRVLYPLWYEARPFVAALRGRRRPSRFDIREATVS
jgi:SAM-dependent methyltransferase